jgi:hypothetical protein
MPGGVYDSGKCDSGDCAELSGGFFINTDHIYHLVTARFNGWIKGHSLFTSNILPEDYIYIILGCKPLEGC